VTGEITTNDRPAGGTNTRPTIAIPGGALRPVRGADQAAIADLLRDPDVRRFMCDDRIVPDKMISAMLRNDALDAQRGLGFWMIEFPAGQGVGLAGMRPLRGAGGNAPYVTGVIEPVIALCPRLWGSGLAATALGALIGHMRDYLKLDRLVAVADRPNVRSHALLRRLGFASAGTTSGLAHELLIHVLDLEGTRE